MVAPRFRTVQKFKSDYCDTDFAVYESSRTGLRVVVAHQQTPKIWCNLVVATEIHEDSGAPHTLEHLVFTASRSYLKGFLDRLATRSYGETNAYTDTDRTVYQLECVGWDGFAQTLPVYLEHLLLPTLSDAACYTEVHHIDGAGQDAGVVYSEMQGRENTVWDLQELKAKRQIYPKESGFRYDIGGLLENLRVLTNERIRNFHKQMYQPKNLCVAVVGDIDDQKLLKTLDTFEDTIVDLVPRLDEPFDRPWEKSGKTPTLSADLKDTLEFPEADEEVGQIQITYLGPDCRDTLQSAALGIFTTYLSGGPVAVLDKAIVEEEQLASSVLVQTSDRPDSTIEFYLIDVKTENLDAVADRFLDILKEASQKPLDMSYLKDCILRIKRYARFSAEVSPEEWLDEMAIDHVFGDRHASYLRNSVSLSVYDELDAWSEKQWLDFFRKWFIDNNHAIILAKPSQALSEKLEKDEEARVSRQKERLGEEALSALADKLESAKLENDKDIPSELLQKYPIPPADSIRFIDTETAQAGFARKRGNGDGGGIQQQIDRDDGDIPLDLHFEHVKSNFICVGLLVNTHCLPDDLKPLIPIFLMNYTGTPVLRDGKLISFEEVVADLERDCVSTSVSSSGTNDEIFEIGFQVEQSNYITAISWIKTMLFDVVFDAQRLISHLVKMLGSLSSQKRDGDSVVMGMASFVHTTRETTSRTWNLLVKGLHYKQQLLQLQSEPEKLVEKMKALKEKLIDSSSFRCYALGNFEGDAISKPVSSWAGLTENLKYSQGKVAQLDKVLPTLSLKAKSPGNLSYLMPLRTMDTSFLFLYGRGIERHDHPQLPALTLAQAYLEVSEGPLWRAVRGNGLAYGTFLRRSVLAGSMSFLIYRSPDAHKAFVVCRDLIANIASDASQLEDIRIEDAVSNVVKSVASESTSMLSAAANSFTNQVVLGLPKDWSRQFAKKVQQVKKDEIIDALRDFVLPLFKPESANLYATCAPVMEEKLMANLRSEGFPLEAKSWSDFKDDYGIEMGDAEAVDLDDDSDEEEEGNEENDV